MLAHLLFKDHDVLAAETGDHVHLDARFPHALGHRVADGAAHAAAYHAHAFLMADLGGLAHRSHKVGQFVAGLHEFQHFRRLAHRLDHDGDGAGFPVIVGDGQGDALAVLVQTQDDELSGQALFGDQRGLDDELNDRAGLIQWPFAYNRKH